MDGADRSHAVCDNRNRRQSGGCDYRDADTRRASPVVATGRLYKAFWYVPEIGRWVKSDEEYYGSNGVRTQRFTSELESFKHAAR